jgi:hypothetical protein
MSRLLTPMMLLLLAITQAIPIRNRSARNDGHSRVALMQAAQNAKDDEHGFVRGEEELNALANDWKRAEPILLQFADGDQPRRAALAIGILYRHAISHALAKDLSYRTRLQAIVQDRKAPGSARDSALAALMRTRWTDRDEWYVSLFSDPTLMDLRDGYVTQNPLQHHDAIDAWVPLIIRMVGNRDRSVHNNAVRCLTLSLYGDTLKNVVQAMLPWLYDKNWSSASDRLRVIQALEKVRLPEAVPGLQAVVQHDSGSDRAYAAQSLA